MSSRFLACSTRPCGRRNQDVVDRVDAVAVLLAQPDDDGELLAALAEHGRLRAADVRADRAGHARDGQAEQGSLRAIDADGQLRPAFFAADLRVGDARRLLEQLDARRRRCGATRSRSSPRISTASRLSWLPPPSARVSCWLPPEARVVIVVPGMPTMTRAQVGGDLIVRPRPLRARLELHRDVDARRRAAHRSRRHRPS